MHNHIYEQKSLCKLIFTFGIPSILSLMIEMLTGVVDTAFAGNLSGIGESALSAMALIAPILGIFIALQTLFAMSTGILIAKYFNDTKRQNSSYVTGITMSGVVAAITSLFCFVMLPKLLTMLGAEGIIFQLAAQYMKIQLISNVISSLGYTLTCCIRAFGFPKMEVVIISISVVVNVVFNAIFAFVFHWGMRGLAWGTLLSESVCAVLSIVFLIQKKRGLPKEFPSVTEFLQRTRELFKIGIAQTIIQMLGGCTGIVVNARLLALGSMTHIAAWSVVQRIYSLVLIPIIGLTQGVQNIIAYFNGNAAEEKIHRISKLTMTYCSIYGILALGMMMVFGKDAILLFGKNKEILTMANEILLVVFIGFPFIGVLYTDMTLLQVTEHEIASVLLILSRQVFFLIPLIYLVPFVVKTENIGISPAMSLFLCMPIADLLATGFALMVKKCVGHKN
ncbi:MAG: MATE family efflux transporter [Lachnospiraceae bacterium]